MLRRHVFHLERRHVLAFDAHAVGHAAVEEHIAVDIPRTDIAGVKAIRLDRACGRLGIVEIARGDRTGLQRPDDNLAALTIRHGLTVRILQTHLEPRQWLADRTQHPCSVVGRHARTLGHTVAFADLDTEPLLELPPDIARTAAAERDRRAMRAIELGRRLLEQDLQQTTEEMNARRAKRLDLTPERRGAEAVDHRQLRFADQRHHDHLRAADMKQRLPHMEHVAVLCFRYQRNGLARQAQHAVGNDNALWPSGRAGGVHDRVWRIGIRHGIIESGGIRQAGFQRFFRRARADNAQLRFVERQHIGFQRRHQIMIGDNDARSGVFNDIAQIIAAALNVGRHPHCANLADRKQQRNDERTIPRHHQNAIAGNDALGLQPVGQRRRLRVDLGARHRCIAIDRKWPRGMRTGALNEKRHKTVGGHAQNLSMR